MEKKTAVLMILALLVLTLTGCTGGTSPSDTPNISSSASPSAFDTDVSPSASPSDDAVQDTTLPADASALTLEDYFPFEEDVHRTYVGSGIEYAAFESWVDYIKDGALQLRKNNSGTELVEVYLIEDGALLRAFSQEETYFRQDFTDRRGDSEVILMEPLETGTSWTIENGLQRSITATNAAVTVPYGTFTALEVTTLYDGSTTKSYYAPELGLIKTEFISGEDIEPITSELENYEEGSPLRQYAHFYYPDFTNDRVAYIEQTFELYTNEEIAGIFEQVLKTVPEGSGLTPVFTEDAELNSVSYDNASGVVTADVSPQFITGMNAGASLEGLILQSLANTLGWYFQTDKVQLTVNGGPYESGHYLFNAGEYLPYDTSGAVAYDSQP